MFSGAPSTRVILLAVLTHPTGCARAPPCSCARLQDAARLLRRGGAAAAGETGAAVMPPIDEEYDLLLTEDFGGGGGGGAGFPSHNGDDETLLYPTLASTTSMPKTDTKKAFFLLGLIGAVADLDRRAFFVVVAVTNLYAMRFLKAHVRPALTKWMCCNTRFPVWKSTSRRWRWRPETWFPHRQLLDSGIARTIRTERTITRPEVDTVWDLLKSKNKPTTTASERADPCEKWLDQCGR